MDLGKVVVGAVAAVVDAGGVFFVVCDGASCTRSAKGQGLENFVAPEDLSAPEVA